MPSNKLTVKKIESLTKPGRYGDGLGLWLQVSKWKTKSWVFQFTSQNGRVRQLGLGPLHTVSLASAREKAQECRGLVRDGKDPIDLRRQARLANSLREASILTFSRCAEKYIATHGITWRNPK